MVNKNNNWIEDNRNLANNWYFNIIWFGFWIVSLIIFSKETILNGSWDSFASGIISAFMLFLQFHWTQSIIKHLR